MPIAADPRAHRFDPDPAAPGWALAKTGSASLSLPRRLLLALLAPLALLALAAGIIYWSHGSRHAIVELPDRGMAMAALFAQAAEHGISTGGAQGLENLLQTVRAQPGVRAAAVYDRSGAVLAVDGERGFVAREMIVDTRHARVVSDEADRLVVAAPVLAEPVFVPLADRFDGDARGARPAPAQTIGWVQLEFDAGPGGQDAGGAAPAPPPTAGPRRPAASARGSRAFACRSIAPAPNCGPYRRPSTAWRAPSPIRTVGCRPGSKMRPTGSPIRRRTIR